MEDGFLEPVADEDSAPFWAAARSGELRMQACAGCGQLRFPPQPMCPHCHSTASSWQVMSGLGTIWSYVVPHPPLLPAYERWAPFNVVLVQLDEDPEIRLTGNLLASADGHVNEIDPATITIGERVRAVFRQVSADLVVPQWVRLEPS
ncbi:MAG: uncharacterized protein QOK11_2196 [Pseudonocardiales bacterium]|nr:uncharacterized protein [Pseudonocardiales bacterium]